MSGHGDHSKPLPKIHLTWGDREATQDPTGCLLGIIDANPIGLDKLSTYASLVYHFKKLDKDLMGLQSTLEELKERFKEHLKKQSRRTEAQIVEKRKLSNAVEKLEQVREYLAQTASIIIGKFAVHIAIAKKPLCEQDAYLTSAETDDEGTCKFLMESLEKYPFDDLVDYIGLEEYNRVVEKHLVAIKYDVELLR